MWLSDDSGHVDGIHNTDNHEFHPSQTSSQGKLNKKTHMIHVADHSSDNDLWSQP